MNVDGCLADSSWKAQQWLAKTDTPDRFGIVGMKETARPLSEYTSLTTLVLDKSDTTCFIEANTATASIINGMARMHLLDKIILCTIPVIAGNGCRLFLGDLPESEWMRDETKKERGCDCSESEHFPAQKQAAKNPIRWTAVCPIVLCAHTSTQV